ncbi:protein translocase subunit SecF, partial [Campylobacter jejuni]|nr:protein translocase subunit SecF [Campylobacter jejuni]
MVWLQEKIMQFFSEKKIYDFMRMRFAAISFSFILFF